MSRSKFGDLAAAVRARFSGNPQIPQPYPSVACNTQNAAQIPMDWSNANTFEFRWKNAAGTDDVRALSVNATNQVMVAEALATGCLKTVTWEVADNGSISSQGFFLVNPGEQYRVVGISWYHVTQSSVGGTAYVEKTPNGFAIGSGTTLMSGTFNLHAIANNTVTAATLTTTNTGDSDNPDLILNPGDQLSVVIAGTTTSLAGVHITVVLAPLGQSVKTISYYMKANADMVQGQTFFVANRAYGNVLNISMRWSTKSSVSGLKLTVTKDSSTTAPGGGTSLLTDNTNAGVLVTQAANTTYTGTVSSTAATIRLAVGDRLAVEFSGASLTALIGLVVTVSIAETASDRVEKTFFLDHVPGGTDLTGITAVDFWTADRDYEVVDAREVHGVAGNDAGSVTVAPGIATGTTAPGSATSLLSAAFNVKATANTVQTGSLNALGTRFLLKGDRLCLIPSGTFTTAAGLSLTVGLIPR